MSAPSHQGRGNKGLQPLVVETFPLSPCGLPVADRERDRVRGK